MSGLISNGTYVLGDPNTRDLYLGNGLKAGFEGDKYYIAADETVLWEGESSHSITVNESVFNFEYIEVEVRLNGLNSIMLKYPVDSIVNTNKFNVGVVFPYSATELYVFGSIWDVSSDGKTLSSSSKGVGFSTAASNSTTFYKNNVYNGKICKVIGINRKRD